MFIRWGNPCSTKFRVTNGVKQGGILSPSPFNVYMNNLSVSLKHSGIGGSLGGNLINHLCYGEDHHITPILIELNWLTITKRCQYKLLVLTFKVLHSQAPGYISDFFNWYTPARALRSASTTSLIPNRSKTIKFGRRLVGTSSAAL